MVITTNTSSIYSSISTSQTASTTQNTSNSFNTLVNTQNQDITTSSTNNKVYKKINDFLDAHNGYSSLSPTDEKIFRDILSDNKLTKEEANSLPKLYKKTRDCTQPLVFLMRISILLILQYIVQWFVLCQDQLKQS